MRHENVRKTSAIIGLIIVNFRKFCKFFLNLSLRLTQCSLLTMIYTLSTRYKCVKMSSITIKHDVLHYSILLTNTKRFELIIFSSKRSIGNWRGQTSKPSPGVRSSYECECERRNGVVICRRIASNARIITVLGDRETKKRHARVSHRRAQRPSGRRVRARLRGEHDANTSTVSSRRVSVCNV